MCNLTTCRAYKIEAVTGLTFLYICTSIVGTSKVESEIGKLRITAAEFVPPKHNWNVFPVSISIFVFSKSLKISAVSN